MENPENSSSQENINEIQLEENPSAEKFIIEENTSSKSISHESVGQSSSTKSDFELPECVPPNVTNSSQSIQPSLRSTSRCSTFSFRCNELSIPKTYCLEDTIAQHGGILKERTKNLRKLVRDHKPFREVTECIHLKNCTPTPTPHPPSGRRSPVHQQQQDEKIQKLNEQLKRYTFDRLAEKIFAKLPNLVLHADISNLSQQSATTQVMINVIFSTICKYAGRPQTIHDHELYQHLSVGLARFIEDVVGSVQQKVYSDESIAPKEAGQRNRVRCSISTALLANLSEANILRSCEILNQKHQMWIYQRKIEISFRQ